MEVSKELFYEFIEWLKRDGLVPKKSERLWKKTIFSRLINDDKRTIENWEDFMVDFNLHQTPKEDFDENCLIGMGVSIMGVHKTIRNVVKCDMMSRIFFIDGTDIDVDNTVPIQLINAYARNQHVNG